MRTIRVDRAAEQVVFEGWGTSLAWWANAVGRWPHVERRSVVRRLFGTGEDGLGLTVARFNAGGGENPALEITMEPRAVMEGYRPAPGVELEPDADVGQRAILREAAAVVAEGGGELVVEVFGNSPPWWATISGSVTGASSGRNWPAPNLNPVYSREYLRYLGDVASFIERDAHVRVASLSPFNEPTSRWWVLGGRQEGCHFTPTGIDRLLTELSELPEVVGDRLVAASEEWSVEQALTTWDALGPTARRVTGRLNTHTYDGAQRSALRARAARARVPLWVSEFGEGGASGRELALAIVRDLRELAPSAWVLWQAASPDAWGLFRLTRDATALAETPKLAVFARFTHSIRPGMTLVGCDDPQAIAAVGRGRFSAVIVADEAAETDVRLEVGEGVLAGNAEVAIVRASGEGGEPRRLVVEPVDGALDFTLPAGAVASVTAALAVGADPRACDRGFLGSGTWWLEHESGSRLGLAASGDDELGAGVRVAGVAPDDGAPAQRWRAEACGGGATRWVCEASGHQLDVERGSRRAGAHAIQWRAGCAVDAAANNRFRVEALADGAVELVVEHSGLALALDARGLGVQRPRGERSARWRLRRASGVVSA